MKARAVGPYSLVTQQPLDGQEVTGQQFSWLAQHGFDALFAEFASVKADAVALRTRMFEAIICGQSVSQPRDLIDDDEDGPPQLFSA